MGCGASVAKTPPTVVVQNQLDPTETDLNRESTLDILMPRQVSTIIIINLEDLEDLIVDESVDRDATLKQCQVLVNKYSENITQFFKSCRANEDKDVTVSRKAWISWAIKIDADIDEDTANNQYSSVCGYQEEEGGEEPPVPCDLARFACCLVRVANLWFIQNKGNPMDSDIPNQIETFWQEIVKERISKLCSTEGS